ncbi:MAG TPA: phospholipase D-like domain-containing protein [Patescibacteria group bacterium]|jgi:phosphatidylserine/phosphatidylglycerophosphate/cardiolipin synthase-like enzyme
MTNTSLFDEKTFYGQFLLDLKASKQEVIIESPFITSKRMGKLWKTLNMLVSRGIKVFVITRDPDEHEYPYSQQSEVEIRKFEQAGIQTLICTGNHHRKLAMIDRKILWEGSLNIFSQTNSREIMRRFEDKETALETFEFLKLGKFIS